MTDSFHTDRPVTGRKSHRCVHCRGTIPAGVSHLYTVGKFEGDFYADRGHHDCRGLWSALFKDWHDGFGGMTADLLELFTESGDKDAVAEALDCHRGHFPHAVCRVEFRLRHWLEA